MIWEWTTIYNLNKCKFSNHDVTFQFSIWQFEENQELENAAYNFQVNSSALLLPLVQLSATSSTLTLQYANITSQVTPLGTQYVLYVQIGESPQGPADSRVAS